MKRGVGLGVYVRIALLNALTIVTFHSFGQAASLPQVSIYQTKYVAYEEKTPRVGFPTRIVLPSVGIDLEVTRGSYNINDGSWTLGNKKAYYADVSVPVNDSNGTTLIYGHAQTPVFAALTNLSSNATATVYSDSNYVFHYRFEYLKEVIPTDTSVFTEKGSPILVLQTCTGTFDSHRALYTFKLEEVVKA